MTTKPPHTLRPIPDAIPEELRDGTRFVLWRWVLRAGKWTKPPYTIDGALAKVNDSETWTTFDAALSASRNGRGFDGIGRMLTTDDGYVGLDLDHCRDLESGVIEEWALTIVERFSSYTEVSPSGTGLRILVHGTLPPKGRRKKHIEVYDGGRYLTLTGHHLEGTPSTVEDRTAELASWHGEVFGKKEKEPPNAEPTTTPNEYEDGHADATADLADDDLIARAKAAKNGAKFDRLWHGGLSDHGGDWNRADLALATMLVWLCDGDTTRADRLFRRSSLYRAKWDSGRGKSTYGAVTLANAKALYDENPRRPQPPTSSKDHGDEGEDEDEPQVHAAALAEQIVAQEDFAQDAGRQLYVFADGVYRPNGVETVRRWVKALLGSNEKKKKWSPRRANETAEYIRVDAPLLWDSPPLDTLNLLNGLLNVESRELRPYARDFLATTQIPIVFDPDATCPAWDTFIADVFPGDGAALAAELIAWLLLPDTSIQKAILLLGAGSNGKSTFLNALVRVLGRRNVSNLSLHRLELDRFSPVRLYGKLANISPDLPSMKLENTSTFKSIVGGDPIVGERKYEDSFEFQPFARLLFSANTLPQSKDATPAFFRRWHVVPFTTRFSPGDGRHLSQTKLLDRLSAPSELAGLLNRALAVLPKVQAEGLTESPSMRQAREEFRATTDPLLVWLDRSPGRAPGRGCHEGRALPCLAGVRRLSRSAGNHPSRLYRDDPRRAPACCRVTATDGRRAPLVLGGARPRSRARAPASPGTCHWWHECHDSYFTSARGRCKRE